MLTKIISGGQTGADIAALDACLELDFSCGGYCPIGRYNESGKIPKRYPLIEYGLSYQERTKKNVIESDGTVIFISKFLTKGSSLTWDYCNFYKKYGIIININNGFNQSYVELKDFIKKHSIHILNVAGTRASKYPDMHGIVKDIISTVIVDNIHHCL